MSLRINCVVCNVGYGFEDIGTKLFIRTGVCKACYDGAINVPADEWCFAKPELFDIESEECNTVTGICPDRKMCLFYINGHIKPA